MKQFLLSALWFLLCFVLDPCRRMSAATVVTILVRINAISWYLWFKHCERGGCQATAKRNSLAQKKKKTQSPRAHSENAKAQENKSLTRI